MAKLLLQVARNSTKNIQYIQCTPFNVTTAGKRKAFYLLITDTVGSNPTLRIIALCVCALT